MLHDVLAAADLEVWRVFLVAKSGDIWFANQLSMFQNPGHPHVDYPKLKGKAANKVQDNVFKSVSLLSVMLNKVLTQSCLKGSHASRASEQLLPAKFLNNFCQQSV